MIRIGNCLDALSWLFFSALFLAPLIVIFEPSTSEVMILIALEALAGGLFWLVSKPVFELLYPDTIGVRGRFSLARSRFHAVVAAVALIPSFWVMAFFWSWSPRPAALDLFVIVFGAGVLAISGFLGSGAAGARFCPPDELRELHGQPGIFAFGGGPLLGVLLSLVLLEWAILHAFRGSLVSEMAGKVTSVAVVGFLAALVVWWTRTRHFATLLSLLQQNEREFASFVLAQADRGRYRALGQLASLIAHDLAGPLHVAKFCVRELKASPPPERAQRYLDQLSRNVDRAVELMASIREDIKSPRSNPAAASIAEAHAQALSLLESQFPGKHLSRVVFDLDPRLHAVAVSLKQADLIQVLDNLYRNSVSDLLSRMTSEPRISVRLIQAVGDEIEILISDNGTGLSPDRFEQLTRSDLDGANVSGTETGLGLRLVRRLVEANDGRLSVLPGKENLGTTTMCLRLRLASTILLNSKAEASEAVGPAGAEGEETVEY